MSEAATASERLGDAHDEPDTGVPPCVFCKRAIPCECDGVACMCTCGRCRAEPLPEYVPRTSR